MFRVWEFLDLVLGFWGFLGPRVLEFSASQGWAGVGSGLNPGVWRVGGVTAPWRRHLILFRGLNN